MTTFTVVTRLSECHGDGSNDIFNDIFYLCHGDVSNDIFYRDFPVDLLQRKKHREICEQISL